MSIVGAGCYFKRRSVLVRCLTGNRHSANTIVTKKAIITCLQRTFLVAPVCPSSVVFIVFCLVYPHVSELDTELGTRPPGAPQVQRNGRGSSQREQGLLLLARRLADAAQTSRGVPAGQDHRHVGHRQRPAGAVPHEVSYTRACGQVKL